MKKLLTMAEQIKDKRLRKLVIEYIKECKPVHREFAEKITPLKKAPAADSWHHTEPGGLILHTYSTAMLCLAVADVIEDIYDIAIDRDVLIASALVHDLMKVAIYLKDEKGGWKFSDTVLDALVLGVADLYARGFPKKVIETVAAHHGDKGPVDVFSPESIILHYIDTLDAFINSSSEDVIKNIDIQQFLELLASGAENEKGTE